MKEKKIICILILVTLWMLIYCKGGDEGVPEERRKVDISHLKPAVPFDGKIVFQSDLDGDNEIYLLTKNGLRKLTNNSWNDEYPKWSPDGKKIAFTANPKGSYDIFVMNEDGSKITQITSTKENAIEHAWFPDSKRLAYTIERRKRIFRSYTLWMIDLKSGKKERLIPQYKGSNALPNFSPTEPLMGFTGKRTRGWDVAMYHLQKKEFKFLTEGGKACRPHFSKDGKKIAYVSSKADGKGDIWLMNPDGSGKIRLTRRDETYDYFPSWSPDNKFIVFSSSPKNHKLRGNWALYLVKVKTKRIIPLLDTLGRDLFPDWY
ncbi:MAG: TolB family protein [Candidatus Aminicenantia bacterium]